MEPLYSYMDWHGDTLEVVNDGYDKDLIFRNLREADDGVEVDLPLDEVRRLRDALTAALGEEV